MILSWYLIFSLQPGPTLLLCIIQYTPTRSQEKFTRTTGSQRGHRQTTADNSLAPFGHTTLSSDGDGADLSTVGSGQVVRFVLWMECCETNKNASPNFYFKPVNTQALREGCIGVKDPEFCVPVSLLGIIVVVACTIYLVFSGLGLGSSFAGGRGVREARFDV